MLLFVVDLSHSVRHDRLVNICSSLLMTSHATLSEYCVTITITVAKESGIGVIKSNFNV